MMLQFWRVLQAGARNFVRNAWLSMAATVVMTVTLVIIVTSFVMTTALGATIKQITDKLDVSVYLQDSVTAPQLQTLENRLRATGNVADIQYISKSAALKIYNQENVTDPSLLQAVSETNNPLPASINVKANDPNHLSGIAAVVNEPDMKALQSDAPSYSGDRKATIDKIVRISNFIKTAGLTGSIIFIVISTLIIFNTIRMAIFTRRDEVEIMQLVGATKWFIRGPFICEAALYGIIAAVIALGLSYALVVGGGPKISSYVDVTSTVHLFRAYPVAIVLVEMLIGVAIGAGSALLAISRYLKV